jgi:hypothetical protein
VRFSDLGLKLGLALIVMIGTACTTRPPPPPTIADPTASTEPDEPLETTSARPSTVAIDLPEPGRPFDAATLLTAMRESRRPGGVPGEIETDVIAMALADAVWTFDGQPWTTMAAAGSCGPTSCTLEIAGTRDGTQGDDLWAFEVRPSTGSVEVVSADLRSLPTGLLVELEELTRSVDPRITAGLRLTSARWLPPPVSGHFVLSFRTGDSGSCGVDYTFDAIDAAVVSEAAVRC